MPSIIHACLFLVAALTLAGCATPKPAPPSAASASPLPLEIIPSGAPTPVDFRVSETTGRLQVIVVATEAIHDLHTDVHLIGASGKVIATKIATTHVARRTRQTVAQFPLAEVRTAAGLRIVYHVDAPPSGR